MRLAVLIGSLLAASPALSDCRESFLALAAQAPAEYSIDHNGPIQEVDGGCSVDGLRAQSAFVSLQADRLTWVAENVKPGFTEFDQDLSLSIRVERIRMQPRFGDPLRDYLMQQQYRENLSHVVASLSYGHGTGTLAVTLELDLPSDSNLVYRSRVSGLRLMETDPQKALGKATLEDFYMDLSNTGIFDSLLMAPAYALLQRGQGTPEERAAALREMSLDMIEGLPVQTFPSATKRALTAMIEDAPFPHGRLTVGITEPVALGPLVDAGLRLAPASPQAFAAGMGDAQLVASFAAYD